MGVEIDLVYEGGLHCTATHGPSGNTLVTDAPVDNGGKGAAFSPTDLVATALGTCMVTIMAMAAQCSGIELKGTRLHVVKEMTAAPDRRIKQLTVTLTLPKELAISETDKEKLKAAAETCPVKKSLHPDTAIVIQFEYPK